MYVTDDMGYIQKLFVAVADVVPRIRKFPIEYTGCFPTGKPVTTWSRYPALLIPNSGEIYTESFPAQPFFFFCCCHRIFDVRTPLAHWVPEEVNKAAA